MFFQICQFNNASEKHDTSFPPKGKEWGEAELEREREEVECGRQGVAEKELQCGSYINLTVGQVFMRAPRRDNLKGYEDDIKDYP